MAKGVVIGGLNSGGGSNIMSRQSGSTSWTTTTTTLDIPIAAVDLSKAVVKLTNWSNSSDPSSALISAELINSTTIRLFRTNGLALHPDNKIFWEVIEFNNVKSKQTGTTGSFSGSQEKIVPISNVDANKCLLITNLMTNLTNTSNIGTALVGSRIISSTSIGMTASGSTTVRWQIIEFN